MALAFESSYGTAPGTGQIRMPFTGTTLGTEQELVEDDILGLGRDPQAPTLDPVVSDGDVQIPIDVIGIGYWLKAAFGDPSTTDNGDGTHTHEWQSGSWTLPSMAIEVQKPDVPHHELVTGCRLDSLSWEMGRSGQLGGTASLIAQGSDYATSAQMALGGSDGFDIRRFGHLQGSISRDGSTLANVVSASVSYNNNLERIETIRSDGKIDGADPAKASMTGQIASRFADTTLLDQATAGDPCEIVIQYQRSAGEVLTLTAHAVYLPRPRISIDGPGGIQVEFNWQAAFDASAGAMCTVSLTNDQASY
jgi:hypothetical protein